MPQYDRYTIPINHLMNRHIEIFDTTLRDGSQKEGVSFSVEDKLRIAHLLDDLGIHYIEGGWPGANPKDDEFFGRASRELILSSAKLVAFGSTRRVGSSAENDKGLQHLVECGVDTVCIVGKTWDYHITNALKTSRSEGLSMVVDTITWLKKKGMKVLLDAEHFFDGWKYNRSFTIEIIKAACDAGVDVIVLCDTNGGTLPHEVFHIIPDVCSQVIVPIGVHFHNDSDCAVANTLTAIQCGVSHIQGCLNGVGERTGNTNLSSLIPNLILKLGIKCLGSDRLRQLTHISHAIAELTNLPLDSQRPYVGTSAFAHKAGLHVSALLRNPDTYEHIDPESVGNCRHLVISEQSGKASILHKASEFGFDLTSKPEFITEVLSLLKNREHIGYQFEVADGSLELLMRAVYGQKFDFFKIENYSVIINNRINGIISSEALIELCMGGQRYKLTRNGNGPVDALNIALRDCLSQKYPELYKIKVIDYKVRVIDTKKGSKAVTRVLIDTTNGEKVWTTIGVSENIIQASWEALSEAFTLGILRAGHFQQCKI